MALKQRKKDRTAVFGVRERELPVGCFGAKVAIGKLARYVLTDRPIYYTGRRFDYPEED